MKKIFIFSFLVLSFSIFIFSACDEDTPQPNNDTSEEVECSPKVANNETIEILPLGDSRVEGASPLFESYRYPLWQNLVNGNWNFDFIGTRKELRPRPALKNHCYDNHHEGTSGAKTTDIINTLNSITFTTPPDVVLLCIGGNDLNQGGTIDGTLSRINQIIDKLQSLNPNVIILLEQIAPPHSIMMTPTNTAGLQLFHQGVAEIATSQTDDSSKVYAINMAENWSDDYMADPLHYNTLGAKVIADKYYAALEEYVK